MKLFISTYLTCSTGATVIPLSSYYNIFISDMLFDLRLNYTLERMK